MPGRWLLRIGRSGVLGIRLRSSECAGRVCKGFLVYRLDKSDNIGEQSLAYLAYARVHLRQSICVLFSYIFFLCFSMIFSPIPLSPMSYILASFRVQREINVMQLKRTNNIYLLTERCSFCVP